MTYSFELQKREQNSIPWVAQKPNDDDVSFSTRTMELASVSFQFCLKKKKGKNHKNRSESRIRTYVFATSGFFFNLAEFISRRHAIPWRKLSKKCAILTDNFRESGCCAHYAISGDGILGGRAYRSPEAR